MEIHSFSTQHYLIESSCCFQPLSGDHFADTQTPSLNSSGEVTKEGTVPD